MKDRLIKLIKSHRLTMIYLPIAIVRRLADYLIANGVIVPPCKVGDTVYYIGGIHHSLVKSAIVEEIIMNSNGVSDLLVTSENNVVFENSIEIFYFTKEEAERALKRKEDEGNERRRTERADIRNFN